jgi:hypothetical protein
MSRPIGSRFLSQRAIVLAMLERDEVVTAESVRQHGITDLYGTIHALRRQGNVIDLIWRSDHAGQRIAFYRLYKAATP